MTNPLRFIVFVPLPNPALNTKIVAPPVLLIPPSLTTKGAPAVDALLSYISSIPVQFGRFKKYPFWTADSQFRNAKCVVPAAALLNTLVVEMKQILLNPTWPEEG